MHWILWSKFRWFIFILFPTWLEICIQLEKCRASPNESVCPALSRCSSTWLEDTGTSPKQNVMQANTGTVCHIWETEKGKWRPLPKYLTYFWAPRGRSETQRGESEEGTGLGRELRGISHFRKHIRGKKFVFIKMWYIFINLFPVARL